MKSLINDPRLTILTEHFITINDLLSNKRKKTELKGLQASNLESKLEGKLHFKSFNPHPVFQVSKIKHKTSPAPFEVTHIELEKDPNLPTLAYGRFVFYNPF